MATYYTDGYQLCLWEPEDKFLREEFKEDNEKIEAALVNHDAAIAKKADASTVTALQTAVNGKADKTALNALTRQVAQGANCRVVTGTYVGTGGYGISKPNTLTFPGNPFFLAVVGDACFWAVAPGTRTGVICSNGAFYSVTLTWSNNAVSWYEPNRNDMQCNTKDKTYHYIALIEV